MVVVRRTKSGERGGKGKRKGSGTVTEASHPSIVRSLFASFGSSKEFVPTLRRRTDERKQMADEEEEEVTEVPTSPKQIYASILKEAKTTGEQVRQKPFRESEDRTL